MNQELFNKLGRGYQTPEQRLFTWQIFLEICEIYLKRHEIKNPVVVELGTRKNKQKRFYEQLFGAEHIGIDISNEVSEPDILGDLHDPEILNMLKEKLKGRMINILFIDADHTYEAVKKDFEIYSPLCSGIIAFDDINLSRHRKTNRFNHGVYKFWDELKREGEYKKALFISTHQHRDRDGLGMLIKKWI